ncbi:hypothetical protein LTR16_004820, partial [Cryomyces antarcticus]
RHGRRRAIRGPERTRHRPRPQQLHLAARAVRRRRPADRHPSRRLHLQHADRQHRLLALRRRLARPPGHPRHPADAHLPAHALLPAHAAQRHHAAARRGAAQVARDRVLQLRRQGPRRAAPGRLRHHRREPVSRADGAEPADRVVRFHLAHAEVEHARRDAEGVGGRAGSGRGGVRHRHGRGRRGPRFGVFGRGQQCGRRGESGDEGECVRI